MSDEELTNVEYISPAAENLAALASTITDISFVIGCCERLQQDDGLIGNDPTYQRALWSAALVAYVRAIWDPRRKWIRKIVEKRIREFDGEPIKFHQYLKDMRDKYISHNVNPYEDFKVGLTLPPAGKDDERVLAVVTFGMQLLHDRGNISTLEKITRALLETLRNISKEHRDKVLEEGKKIPMAKLRKYKSLLLTTPGPEKAGKARRGKR